MIMRVYRFLNRMAVGLALLVSCSVSEARTWTDAKTGRTVEGEYVEMEGEKVTVRQKNGRVLKLPLGLLAEADQEFVKSQGGGVTAGGGAADWPTFRGADRRDHSPDKGLLKKWPEGGPKLLWTSKVGGKGYSGPSIAGGKMYLSGTRRGKAQIYCLDAATGDEVWSADIGDDAGEGYSAGWGGGPRGTPTLDDGLLYAISANGDLACVDASDGSKKWSKNLVDDFGGKVPKWGYSESPLVDGDKLIVTPGGKGGAIVALDKKSGRTLWRSKGLEDAAQYASVIIAVVKGKKQYVQLFMKNLAGVDAESGDLIWKSPWKGGRTAVIPTPIYHDGHVYMTSGYGAGSKLVKIDGDEAEDVWVNKVMKNHHGGVVLVDGYLYGFSDAGGLTCQEWKSGEKKWGEKGEGKSKGAVHYADGMLYCLDESEGSVFLVEATPDGFNEKGRFSMPEVTKLREGTKGKVWTHPVVIGGKMYLRDQDLVFCFDVKE
jgi:outer membrane protein assembly factor BamB